ncbi:MAG: methyltransferase [Pseudobdellovibrionaceae bacterium]
MSSINPFYTFSYSQPEAYHFSHDSVFLARQVFELYKEHNVSSLRCLDLCAGCGVVGLDFIFHCKKTFPVTPAKFDFLEVQEIYSNHFKENVKRLGPVDSQLNFINQNYDALLLPEIQKSEFQKTTNPKTLYDLIVCNPPYFRTGQGKMSPSDFKNRCRFFIDSDFVTLLKAIEVSLHINGSAYILLRNLEDHGWNAFEEAQKILSPQMKIEKIGDIRGTDLVRIKFA